MTHVHLRASKDEEQVETKKPNNDQDTVPGNEAERNEKVWALSAEPGRESGGKSEVLKSSTSRHITPPFLWKCSQGLDADKS